MGETRRLYSVLEIRLMNRDLLTGPGRGKYTLSDVNVWAWVRSHHVAVTPTLGEWPNLKVPSTSPTFFFPANYFLCAIFSSSRPMSCRDRSQKLGADTLVT
jgi:hypothetical protein